MFRFPVISFFSILLVFIALSSAAENGVVRLEEQFDSLSSKWQPITVSGSAAAVSINSGSITIQPGTSISGVYCTTPVSGQFYVETGFKADDNIMLALFKSQANGTADPNNFTSICIDNVNAKVTAFASDRQNGTDNVLDNTGKADKGAYTHVLDGSFYSIRYKGTNGRVRIVHDSVGGFFHLYYGVKRTIEGVEKQDWMEVMASHEWLAADAPYHVAVLGYKGSATYDSVRVVNKPQADKNDSATGFDAQVREFNWSGFWGKATVVTFGPEFQYQHSGYKWVFWDQSNNVPFWYLDNHILQNFEFMETWKGNNTTNTPGCFEPMADRLCRFSQADIVEKSPARIVVRWKYRLINADYTYPDSGENLSTQAPEAEEFYYCYPDGQIIRKATYIPKLDTDFRDWHEVTESILFYGTEARASQYIASPGLSCLDRSSQALDFHPGTTNWTSSNWGEYIFQHHYKSHPDAISAWKQDARNGYRITFVVTWHGTGGNFMHFPVNKVYYTKYDMANSPFDKGIVGHTCLESGQCQNNMDWTVETETRPDGRKARTWRMFTGLAPQGDKAQARKLFMSWQEPGTITLDNSDFVSNGPSVDQKAFLLTCQKISSNAVIGTLKPTQPVVNPALVIKGWSAEDVTVTLNGSAVPFHCGVTMDSGLCVWINATVTASAPFVITKKAVSAGPVYELSKNLLHQTVRFIPSAHGFWINSLPARATISICDIRGRMINRVEKTSAGPAMIHAKDRQGLDLPAGLYTVHIQVAGARPASVPVCIGANR
jgi:hypothetical protein